MKLRSTLVALLLAALTVPALAQAPYPSKPVRIIVPFSPGGATDIITRIVAQKLAEAWGQPIVVENRAGAAGNIGAAEVAKSAPDGYTLFMTSGSIVTANQHIYKKMPFSPEKDLVAVVGVATGPQIVVVPTNSPFKTLADLIAAAKAKPGELNYGHAGIGSQTHLAAENFLSAAGIEVTNIPYKGEAPAVADVVGGQLNFATPNLTAAINFVTQGKLRALAVTSKERVQQLPDVPTVAETLPGFENMGWFGLMAPAGTPREIIMKVYQDTARILGSADLRGRFYTQGMVPMNTTPESFTQQIREETEHWAKVVRERKIVVN